MSRTDHLLIAVTVCALLALAAPLLYAAYAVEPMTCRIKFEMRENQIARTMERSSRRRTARQVLVRDTNNFATRVAGAKRAPLASCL